MVDHTQPVDASIRSRVDYDADSGPHVTSCGYETDQSIGPYRPESLAAGASVFVSQATTLS
jgi:hypothetical protein